MCDPNLLHSTKTILKYLINNGPREQTVNSIYFDFYNYAKTHIPLFELGYSYLVTFLQTIPDILTVDPVSLQVRAPTHQSVSQCNGFLETPRMTFPRVLSWSQPYRESNEYKKIAPEALTVKEPDSTDTSFSLGPRTYGDGKYSSSDSIVTDNEVESDDESKYEPDQHVTTSFVETFNHPIDPKNDFLLHPDKCILRFDHPPSGGDQLNTDNFEEKTEPDLSDSGGVLRKSLYSSSSVEDNELVPDEETTCKEDRNETTAAFVESFVKLSKHSNDFKKDFYFDLDISKIRNISDFDENLLQLHHAPSAGYQFNIDDKPDFEEKTEPCLSDSGSVLHKSMYSSSSVDNELEYEDDTTYKEEQNEATTAFVEGFVKLSKHSDDLKNDFYFDLDISKIRNISDFDKNRLQLDHSPSGGQLNVDDKPEFDNETGQDLRAAGSVLGKSLSSSSSSIIGIPSHQHPVAEKSDKLVEPTYDYDSDNSAPPAEENVCASSETGAIPFMFTELDDKINLLNSCFFSGKYGCKYKTTKIGDLMNVGSVYELYVSEVNNPYKFWFQLDEEIPNAVEELQEHLNECYSMTDYIPDLIKKEHLKKGYACAALYCKVWHRGEVLGPVKDGRVGIYFVDYGTVDQVRIDEVRYLLNSFCTTPKLCHRGTLDYVKPINDRWTVDITTFFLSLIDNRKLTAGVTETDRKNNSVRLYLIDTNTNININYTLVCEGYAYPDDPRVRYQPHMADVVPSFDSLERGEHATFSEVAALLEQNYDYEELMHESVIDDFDFYIPSHVTDAETIELMQHYRNKKEEGKKLAEQRDAAYFLEIFGNILENPFFNGTVTDENVVQKPNPFLD